MIGILKEQLGLRQFRLRNLDKTKGEFALVCGAFNPKKTHQLLGGLSVSQVMKAVKVASDSVITTILYFFDNFKLLMMQLSFK